MIRPPSFSAAASCRNIHIPPILLPPVVFTGLLVGLWIWYVFSGESQVRAAIDTEQEVRDDGCLSE